MSTDARELVELINTARSVWLDVELEAERIELCDEKFGSELEMARYGILGAADRLRQLIDAEQVVA